MFRDTFLCSSPALLQFTITLAGACRVSCFAPRLEARSAIFSSTLDLGLRVTVSCGSALAGERKFCTSRGGRGNGGGEGFTSRDFVGEGFTSRDDIGFNFLTVGSMEASVSMHSLGLGEGVL